MTPPALPLHLTLFLSLKPRYNADGSAAIVDAAAFPEGGLWLCCGSKVRLPLTLALTLTLT